MTHFGVICPEEPGHLNPMLSLAGELRRRGHRVTFYQRLYAERRVLAAGFGFRAFDADDTTAESLAADFRRLGELAGWGAIQFTLAFVRRRAGACVRDVPALVRADGVDALLVDETCVEGQAVAEALGLPFVTVCNALVMRPEPGVPPVCTPWVYRRASWARVRNAAAHRLLWRFARPVLDVVNDFRARHRLPAYTSPAQLGSPLSQISQQPPEFEFPRRELPPHFHFVGPSPDPATRGRIDFPWEKLDGRPLVYASMGTLLNRRPEVFERIARACAKLPVQLVLSLGGGGAPADWAALPGGPVVVEFAPQLELLTRAAACVTHAGLNTALECLAHGVPMVALPVANDQPGVAARIAWTGCGIALNPSRLTAGRLRAALRRVLTDPSYRAAAAGLQAAVGRCGGVRRGADVIENAVRARDSFRTTGPGV